MSRFIDLAGQRFGRLLVVERAENRVTPSGGQKAAWRCLCDCGKSCIVVGTQLRAGKTRSCGCLSVEMTIERTEKRNISRIVGETVFVKLSNADDEMMVDLFVWEEWASRYCWHINANGYAATRFNGKNTIFHDIAFPDMQDGMCVDHIDGNRLDNRVNNLRIVTRWQNRLNCGTRKDNTSGHTGVSWARDKRKWVAQIQVHGKGIRLGRFSNIDDAIAARKAAEIKYFGEYRRKEHTD